ncbi:iron chelate uptake ABC transporter family permease subunit [Planctomycetes bacterium K23_9]|uniref:Manganese transport system membrane protein MntB n=1 Tax=Stieleria marina TaxID=1930275 RepID=A0A517NRN6_9BACT|nr:Manganese transport system membrane protein MntB [Planctomycetes bacterium K23_9]
MIRGSRNTTDSDVSGRSVFSLGCLSNAGSSTLRLLAIACLFLFFAAAPRYAAAADSLADTSATWPTWQQWKRVLSLQDYNTRVVLLGVSVLGAGAGLVGSFTLLRKRALMGDALSHASLPGIAMAFIIASALGRDGKSLGYLLTGATVSGLLGVAAILWIRNKTRLKEDAALGIVLSVFFGAGIALLGIVQQMQYSSAAGLESFIYGKTASMGSNDAKLIIVASAIAIVVCLGLFKELKILCFDEAFAGSRGFPIVWLDIVLMSMVVLITIVGLQAVGLILMIALMVIPAAAARFWTHELWRMSVYSVVIGTVGCVLGAVLSAVFPNLPSGAMIVLVCSFFFFLSMMFGTARGVVIRTYRRRRLNRRIARQHLLRAMYEHLEPNTIGAGVKSSRFESKAAVTVSELLPMRSWGWGRLLPTIRAAQEDELLRFTDDNVFFTRSGFVEAARLTRQHRLWEMYLIAYADVAPGLVDRGADDIEHVLGPEIVDQLEDLLEEQKMTVEIPESPHGIGVPESAGPQPGGSTS